MGREARQEKSAATGPGSGQSRQPVGVIDIGSNSIRLVIFENARRFAVPLFNEKVQCALGRGVNITGKLDPEGVKRAFPVLERFHAIAEAMRVTRLDAVATAAVRDAKDGAAFVAEAQARCGVPVRIISGAEEASLAADGVLSAIQNANGLVGDLGGGSLELTRVVQGQKGENVTLSIGPFQLIDAAQGSLGKARRLVDEALAAHAWLSACKGETLYAVGGIWRSLARLHMRQNNYSLHVLHHYSFQAKDAENLLHVISGLSRKSLESLTGLARRRLEALPYGALVMERLIGAARISRIVISAYGLREGLLFHMLPAEERARDPLIAAAQDMARQMSRFPAHGEELAKWTEAIFDGETPDEKRLRLAACYLSDINWRAHPDYRGVHAFNEILRAPMVGIDHPGRAFLAQTVFHRYTGGDEESEPMPEVAALTSPSMASRALQLGLALRLGHTFSASAPGILSATTLARTPKAIVLRVPQAFAPLAGEVARKRLAALSESFDIAGRVEFVG